MSQHPNATTQERIDNYHNVSHRVGFYNNFFVADISFFTTEPVKGLLKAIDESNLIYTQRTGDLVIHSTAVRLFARPDQIQWFRDFTYEHMSELGVIYWMEVLLIFFLMPIILFSALLL